MSELHVVIGSGPVGRATAEALAARGKRVRLLSRSGRMDEPPAGAELVSVDVLDAAALDAALRGAAAVYQCAQPEYSRWVEEFPALQRAVLGAAARSGARLVLADNLYPYGDRDGKPMSEDSPYTATDAKGKVRAAMSEEAFAAHRAGRLRVSAARASDFFGPWAWEQSHLGARSLGPLSRGKAASMLGALDLPHTFTYVRDFGAALAELGLSDKGDGKTWFVPSDRPRQTQREAMAEGARALGLPLRVSALGRPMMTILSLFVPVLREILPLLYQFEKPYIMESGAFERTFGLKATPFDRAMAETVAWARSRGLVPAA